MNKEELIEGLWYKYHEGKTNPVYLFKYRKNGDKIATKGPYVRDTTIEKESNFFAYESQIEHISPANMKDVYKYFPEERPKELALEEGKWYKATCRGDKTGAPWLFKYKTVSLSQEGLYTSYMSTKIGITIFNGEGSNFYENITPADMEEVYKIFPKEKPQPISKEIINPVSGEIYVIHLHKNPEWDSIFLSGGGMSNINRLYLNKPEYNKNNGTWSPSGSYEIREATNEEKIWLKACSEANKFIPKEEALSSPVKEENMIGRYIKVLKDYPNAGAVRLGEIGKIIIETDGELIADFPSQYDYCCNKKTIKQGGYEIMPEGWSPDQICEYAECIQHLEGGGKDRYIKGRIYPVNKNGIPVSDISTNLFAYKITDKSAKDWFKPSTKEEYDEQQKNTVKESSLNTYGLKVGDELREDILNAYGKQANYIIDDGSWQTLSSYSSGKNRIIESFEIKNSVTVFKISNTCTCYGKAEGFKEFMENFDKPKYIQPIKKEYKIGERYKVIEQGDSSVPEIGSVIEITSITTYNREYEVISGKSGHGNSFTSGSNFERMIELLPIKQELSSLPEKWCIKAIKTEPEYTTLANWRTSGSFVSDGYLMCGRYKPGTKGYWENFKPEDYTEITFEQFQKWVLKEENMENRPEYVKCIASNDSPDNWTLDKVYKTQPNGIISDCSYDYKKSSYAEFIKWISSWGVVFVPATKAEYLAQSSGDFKPGDWVEVLNTSNVIEFDKRAIGNKFQLHQDNFKNGKLQNVFTESPVQKYGVNYTISDIKKVDGIGYNVGVTNPYKFKVGDKVIGNERANVQYLVTKKGWRGTVVSTDEDITGKDCFRAKSESGSEYTLKYDCFDLLEKTVPIPKPSLVIDTVGSISTFPKFSEGDKLIVCSKEEDKNKWGYLSWRINSTEQIMGVAKRILTVTKTRNFEGRWYYVLGPGKHEGWICEDCLLYQNVSKEDSSPYIGRMHDPYLIEEMKNFSESYKGSVELYSPKKEAIISTAVNTIKSVEVKLVKPKKVVLF